MQGSQRIAKREAARPGRWSRVALGLALLSVCLMFAPFIAVYSAREWSVSVFTEEKMRDALRKSNLESNTEMSAPERKKQLILLERERQAKGVAAARDERSLVFAMRAFSVAQLMLGFIVFGMGTAGLRQEGEKRGYCLFAGIVGILAMYFNGTPTWGALVFLAYFVYCMTYRPKRWNAGDLTRWF